MKPLIASDIMQTDVLTVNSDASIVEAAIMMLRNKISGLPVVDWRRTLVGIVTEGDLLRRSEIATERRPARWLELLRGPGREAAEYTQTHAHKVGEIMTERVVSVSPDAPLADVVALMEQHRIKRIPVLADDRLIGIVSRADLLRALVDATPTTKVAPVDDGIIRNAILSELDRQEWSPCATIHVGVKDGIVELTGCITDYRERAALKVLAENVAGVKQVVDHMVWIEPLSGTVIDAPAEPMPGADTTYL